MKKLTTIIASLAIPFIMGCESNTYSLIKSERNNIGSVELSKNKKIVMTGTIRSGKDTFAIYEGGKLIKRFNYEAGNSSDFRVKDAKRIYNNNK